VKKAGLLAVNDKYSPPFVWIDGVLTKEDALDYKPHQKCGKFPGMDIICYKSTFFQSMNEFRQHFPSQFRVYPRTYLLPRDLQDVQRDHMNICSKKGYNPSWVVKPKAGSCGNGIKIVQSISEIQNITYQSVIQQYVNPYLINGKKFDFRFYILITSLEPLTFYIYNEGIARFCTELYEPPSRANKEKQFIHLTNTAINVENGLQDPSTFTLKASDVLQKINDDTGRKDEIWEKICECSRAAIIGITPKLLSFLPTHTRPLYSVSKQTKEALNVNEAPNEAELEEKAIHQQPYIANTVKAEIIKKQTNMVLMPHRKSMGSKLIMPDFDSNPIVVGSIVNYQIIPKKSNLPLLLQRKYEVSMNHQTPPAQPSKIEKIEEQHEQKPETEEISKYKALKLKNKFYHVLGIDIILDYKLNPLVLELNDRPSLCVTVGFEKDLKEGLLAESFEHMGPNGELHAQSDSSKWQLIYPLPMNHEYYSTWKEISTKALHPKSDGSLEIPCSFHSKLISPIPKPKKAKKDQ